MDSAKLARAENSRFLAGAFGWCATQNLNVFGAANLVVEKRQRVSSICERKIDWPVQSMGLEDASDHLHCFSRFVDAGRRLIAVFDRPNQVSDGGHIGLMMMPLQRFWLSKPGGADGYPCLAGSTG